MNQGAADMKFVQTVLSVKISEARPLGSCRTVLLDMVRECVCLDQDPSKP